MDGGTVVVRRGADSGELPGAGACSSGEKPETVSGFSGDVDGAAASVPCRGCGAAFTPRANPRYCDACQPGLADRLRRAGTPIERYLFPEAVFGADDRNVRKVKAAAAKAGRS